MALSYKMVLGWQAAGGDTTTGLLSYWIFNEGSGTTAADSQPAANTASLIGTTPWGSDGTGNYLAANNTTIVWANAPTITGYSASTLTVFCWVNAAASANASIFTHYDFGSSTNQGSWLMGTDQSTGTHLRVYCTNDPTGATQVKEYLSSTTPFSVAAWHSYAFRFNAGVLDLFVDGVKDPTPNKLQDNAITTLYNSTANIGFAAIYNNAAGQGQLTGKFRKFRIYNVAKTDADIAAIHALGN